MGTNYLFFSKNLELHFINTETWTILKQKNVKKIIFFLFFEQLLIFHVKKKDLYKKKHFLSKNLALKVVQKFWKIKETALNSFT